MGQSAVLTDLKPEKPMHTSRLAEWNRGFPLLLQFLAKLPPNMQKKMPKIPAIVTDKSNRYF